MASGYYSNSGNKPYNSNHQTSSRTYASPTYDTHKMNDREREYEENANFQYLKKWYETRLKGLSEDIRSVFKLVQSDALIDTMKQDSASEEYIGQRVKEIIDDYLANSRETLLEKMALQYGYLKDEYARIEHENMKLYGHQQESLTDITSKNEKLQEQYRNEVQAREFYENESKKLKLNIHDLTKSYEEALSMRDEQARKKSDQDSLEKQELENRLRDSELKCRELQQRQSALQKELEILDEKNRQQEIDTSAFKTEVNRDQRKIAELMKVIDESERVERDLRHSMNSLRDENDELKANLSQIGMQKRELENRYKRFTEEMANEHEGEIEKLNRACREKIEQYKRKIIDYKDRVNEREKEIQRVQRKDEEDNLQYKKNIEVLESRLQEQRSFYEKTLREINEENEIRMNEIARRHEDQLKEVQINFKELLDEKIAQMNHDTEEQINELRKKEKEAQCKYEEKIMELERDSVKLEHHEKITDEKNLIIQKLRDENARREIDYRQDITNKLRTLEERLVEEHNARERSIRVTISGHEQQMREMNETKTSLEHELKMISEERKALNEYIEQLENQKRQLHESVEEWAAKTRKLKVSCDEEQSHSSGLERELRVQQEKLKDLNENLETVVSQLDAKEKELQDLNKETFNLGSTLKEGGKERKKLERDINALNIDLQETQEKLRMQHNENDALKEQNKGLMDRVNEVIKTEGEKLQKEADEHFETKNKLLTVENRLEEVRAALEENEDQLQQMNEYLEQQNQQNKNLSRNLEETRERLEEASKLKLAGERRIDQILIRTASFRRVTVNQLDLLRSQLRELISFNASQINSLVRVHEEKFFELLTEVKLVLGRKDKQYQNSIDTLKNELSDQFFRDSEKLKAKYYKDCLQLQEEYENKYEEKERELKFVNERNYKLSEKVNDLERETERRDIKQTQLEGDFLSIQKEKGDLNIRFEQVKQSFVKEIEKLNESLNLANENALSEKRALEEGFTNEVSSLKNEIGKLSESYSETLRKHDEQVAELTLEQELKVKAARDDLLETRKQLEKTMIESNGVEERLNDKVVKLESKVSKLKNRTKDLEVENKSAKDFYESRLYLFEEKLSEVNKAVEEENQAVTVLTVEKANEISDCVKVIRMLEEDVKSKTLKISALFKERDSFEKHIREIESELDLKNDQINMQKQSFLDRTLQQTKEIEQLHYILSKSYRTKDEPSETLKKRDTRVRNSSTSSYETGNSRLKSEHSKTDRDFTFYKSNDSFQKIPSDKEKAKSLHPNMLGQQENSTKREVERTKRRKI